MRHPALADTAVDEGKTAAQNPSGPQVGRQLGRNPGVDRDEHHVGLRGLDREHGFQCAWSRGQGTQAVGESLGIAMIVRESLQVMGERVAGGCGQNTHLTHATAQHFADAHAARDLLVAAQKQGANGRAQALGEAQGDRIERRADRLGRGLDCQRVRGCGCGVGSEPLGPGRLDRRVHQSGAVQVGQQAVLATKGPGCLQVRQRQDLTADGIFEPE